MLGINCKTCSSVGQLNTMEPPWDDTIKEDKNLEKLTSLDPNLNEDNATKEQLYEPMNGCHKSVRTFRPNF